MELLICGVLVWSLVHLVPSLAPTLKQGWQGKLGENGYKATFALLIASGLALMIFGWRSATPAYLYHLPAAARSVALLLLVVGFLLFGAANYQTRIKRVVRHPQLTGVLLWAVAHLLLNGDSRSLVLFGGLGAWAVLEMVFINRRDGAWVKPEAPGWGRELLGLAVTTVLLIVVIYIHPYIAGVPVR